MKFETLAFKSMASTLAFTSGACNWISPSFPVNSDPKSSCRVRVRASPSGNPTVVSSNAVGANGASFVGEKESVGSGIGGGGNGRVGSVVKEKWGKDLVSEDLEVLWDDGYGINTVKDYLDIAREMVKPDGGPPRWFCPIECGRPVKNSPLLLFLPGNHCVTVPDELPFSSELAICLFIRYGFRKFILFCLDFFVV